MFISSITSKTLVFKIILRSLMPCYRENSYTSRMLTAHEPE